MKTIGTFIIYGVNIYLFLLFIRIIFTWISFPKSKITELILKITDPVIEFFKKNTPIRVGVIDLSIVVPFFILGLIKKIVTDFFILQESSLNFIYLLELVIFCVSWIFGLVCFSLLIAVFVLLVVSLASPQANNPVITAVKMVVIPIIALLRKILKINSRYVDQIYMVIMIIGIIIVMIIGFTIINKFSYLLKSMQMGSPDKNIFRSEEYFDYQ